MTKVILTHEFAYLIFGIDLADCVVRTIPEEDLTNGFFVSCFVRKGTQVKRNIEEVETTQQNAPQKKKKKNNKKKKVALTA